MKKKILLSSPHMSEEGFEKKYVDLAFESNWIAPLGQNVDMFENDLSTYSGSKYALALSSGTAAIHMALILSGVEKGDKVACQSLTFAASANPIIYQGATPIFIGSDKDTWNMDPIALEQAIIENPEIKAVIVVHLYGIPAQIKKIKEICDKYNITLIEDAAESLGSTVDGKMTGTFGDYGIYSFNGNKIITTSGGGMLISDNQEKMTFARKLATQAREDFLHYEHKFIGYNYRLSNVSAGIGRGQMKVLNRRISQKQSIYHCYKRGFHNLKQISLMPYVENSNSNCWLTAIILDGLNPLELIEHLSNRGIEARPIWKPMHLQPVFSEYKYYGTRYEEQLFNTGLCLPSDSKMSSSDNEFVIKEIIEFINSKF